MQMPGRDTTFKTGYRYGFNGKEMDNETYGGQGNEYDYGMRIYNPRIGRFLSVDPLQKQYPELSPYQFSSNSPISNLDLDGREAYYFNLTIDANQKPLLTLTEEIDTYKDSKGKQIPRPLQYTVTYKNQTYSFSPNALVAGDFGMAPENTTANLEAWYYLKVNGTEGVPDFDDLFYSRRECEDRLGEAILDEWADGVANAKAMEPDGDGTIYEVPGTGTKSGKPYIGRHNQSEPSKTRVSNDGRDRTQAKVIDKYNAANPEEGAYKEQKTINSRGGIQNLDNKRNEATPFRMETLEQKYGGGKIIFLPFSKSQQKKIQQEKNQEQDERMNHG